MSQQSALTSCYFFFSVKTTIGNGTVSSFLYLATATANDSGIYSCQLPNLAEAKLSLHILNGSYNPMPPSSVKITSPGGMRSTEVAFLLLTQQPWV